ncbi:glycoside hydrolase family 2 protein [Streptomyces spinosirectus]|uniref:glycoside hydrolase family 2 protein n=1 Tax=Streptomyces TaxID=1883 RepID=UPI001C9D8053|nr:MULTISPECIES: glycoside hydrolase family 2 protein [Streptomyces]MBY8345129.1 glycoside hydrolase family 2 protein [Streptomyces plumbidurans]UIR15528.1 glycoside hydrolase family 2 protein [Streptomyces spinosirectus]
MKVSTPLTRGWTVRLDTTRRHPEQAPETLPVAPVAATVPGCVHTDLLTAGLIADPFLDRNETDVAWVGRADWTYSTELPRSDRDHECTDLVFDGLDTVAEIRLGDNVLGRTRNMHRSFRFDVTDALAAGPAPLTVAFTSAYAEAERVRTLLGDRPGAYAEPYQFVRKMACSFGWDWGPTLVTAGLWRQPRLEHWSTARLAEVRPEVTMDEDGTGIVTVHVSVQRSAGGSGRALTIIVTVAGTEVSAELPSDTDELTLRAEVPGVERWWPRGYGEQHLYACTVTLTDDRAAPLEVWERSVGFRTVELDTSADEHGSAFTLVVNGTPVFVRGVNWIPEDVFPSRVTPEDYRRRLEQAAAAGVDLVRVWGGGIYESEDFYGACDELGLLVWQDFPFACAAYPEEEPLRSEVEAEARENVVRLMPHPSLVLWNGNNENLWGFRDWDWEPALGGRSWGEGYYLDLLPRVVAETDPTRPYWAGSPWSGSRDLHPNDPRHGTAHSWEVWNRRDYTVYRDDVPRFVAEFGWQAPPAYATARRSISDEPLTPDSPGMLHHQKAEDGNGKLDRGLAHHFPVPTDFDTWHYLTQVNQARAAATGVEHWRSHWPLCAGVILWQLNDCWPVTSWAAIDGDGREKPLYHELKRLYADRLLTLQDRGGRIVLAAVNQSGEPWTCQARIRRVDAHDGTSAELHVPVQVAARSVAVIDLPEKVTVPAGSPREFLVADADGLRALHFPVPDHTFAYPVPEMTTQVTPQTGGARISVTAHTLVRDLLLQADRLHPDARTDRGLVTLLPGETAEFTVTGWNGHDAEALQTALRCVNAYAAVDPATDPVR